MDEKKIEELAKEIAEVHAVLQEDAVSMIIVVMKIISSVNEAIIEIGKLLSDVLVPMWEVVKDCVEQPEDKQSNFQQVFPKVWDARKKSQVILNKPRFMVRKIIN